MSESENCSKVDVGLIDALAEYLKALDPPMHPVEIDGKECYFLVVDAESYQQYLGELPVV